MRFIPTMTFRSTSTFYFTKIEQSHPGAVNDSASPQFGSVRRRMMMVQTSSITFPLFTQRLLSMLFTINCLPFSPGMTFRILTSPTPQKRPFGLLLKSFTPLVQPNHHRFWSISWPLGSLWNSQSHTSKLLLFTLTRQPRWLLGEQSYQRACRGSKARPPPT